MSRPIAEAESVDSAPFRDELLTADRLAERARSIASDHAWTAEGITGVTPLIGMVDRVAEDLASDNSVLAKAVREQHPISPASEWLLDNYYLLEEQVFAVRADLPANYGAELPSICEGTRQGYPRIYDAIVSLVAHTDARVDEEYLLRFIEGFQDISPLTIGEVWAIPIVLRVALVENLRRLSRRVVRSHEAGRDADEWADRLLRTAQEDAGRLRGLIDELETAGRRESAFYLRLSQRLSREDVGVGAVNDWLERQLDILGMSLDDLSHDLQQLQASDQVSIANSITAIRFLDAYEWRSFFEACSFVEQILRQDPVGVYPRMDFKSRDRYRHALESMARRCPLSEIEVAEAVISWSLQKLDEAPSEPVAGHVGYYLISKGRFGLERSVHYRPHGRELLYRGPLRHHGLFYWGLLGTFTALLLILLTGGVVTAGVESWRLVFLLAVALIPLSDLALNITNRIAAWVFPPRILPKLDFLEPIEEAHRTLVVVPALLSSAGAAQHVIDNLEIAYLANRDENLAFALLGDLKGAESESVEADAAIIEAARQGIETLNKRYLAEHDRRPFHLLVRGRTYNETERVWMGWERKRGALVELNRMLHGWTETSFALRLGDHEFLESVTFVLTLDADTVLPRDAARKLVSTIAHPLNRARLEPGDERVKNGYGLVQPRVAMSLPASSRSLFAWLYSGVTGVDPYAGAVSDTYQDVFGEGSFTGKGIYEVNVFNAVLEGRFPENSLLSHDLIEGNFLRTALASDIQVLDDHPPNYLSHMARLHRWVRGDWQTVPWLLPRVPIGQRHTARNPLSQLHRWKMIDNLRRSLVPPTLMLLIVAGWVLVPEPSWAWPLSMMLLVFFPVYFSLADSMLLRSNKVPLSAAAGSIWRDFGRNSAQASLQIALLPHQAWLMTDAIVRALWRMTITRRNLLEWETAADADRRVGNTLGGFVRRLGPSSALAIGLLVPSVVFSTQRLLLAMLLAVVWAAAPIVAWRVSRTFRRAPEPLDEAHLRELRVLARRTWRFFETFVTSEDHHLAPDNFQQDPKGEVAHRTSPTNIGLQLLGYVTAYDLGYVTLDNLMHRVSSTLHTMVGLERLDGHFYNWYDTRTLRPLPPNYISTVDSGNLAGDLLVLRIALLEVSEAPLLGSQLLKGFADTAELAVQDLYAERDYLAPDEVTRKLREQLEEFHRDIMLEDEPEDLGEWYSLLQRLDSFVSTAAREVDRLVGGTPVDTGDSPHPATPAERARASVDAVRSIVREAHQLVGTLAPWAPLLTDVPNPVLEDHRAAELVPVTEYVPSLVGLAEGLEYTLATLDSLATDPPGSSPAGREASAAWARSMADGIRDSRPFCVELLARLRLNANIAREMWEHTDFRMLFDSQRLLFSIGYNTTEGKLDGSYYDMLASECRLASFLAIAKGDVPQEHWFRLGRSITQTDGGRALLSWSASMFEYLMPRLLMRSWPMTLLDQTYDSVVRRQILYGRERGVPWGVSESAFNAKDANLTYQYQAFGVPGLGLKRGLSDDVVIAPYASVLSLAVAPHEVMANLQALAEQGARGRYGFVEAVDYTPGRIPAGELRALVKAYFAHHQGMSLVALGNELTGAAMRNRFHHDPMVSSAELLLQERVPRTVQLAHPHVEEVRNVRSVRDLPTPVTRSYPLADTPVPATHFLSNGSYSVMVTNGGGGYSRWRGLSVTRYREDVTRDCWGQFFYLRDLDNGRVWSVANNPVPGDPDEYYVTFSADKAEFRRRDDDIETSMEVAVSPEDDVEIRRVTVANRGFAERRIEITSYFEIALTSQGSDQAHKSFSNLFVETELLEETRALLFSRRPRSAEESRPYGFHTLGCETSEPCDLSVETDRAHFLGRLRQVDNPIALEREGDLSGTTGAVLDPSCSIRRSVVIAPGASVRFVYTTGVGESRDDAIRLAEKYHDVRGAQRAIDLGWTAAQIELRDMGLTPQESVVLQRLASRLLLTDPASLLRVKTPVENGLQISGLWSIGISGDHPILLVRVDEIEHAPLVRQALLAHQYWRHKGLIADLVVLNTRPSAYCDELDDRLKLLVRTGHALQLIDKPGGVFLRRADQMHPDVLNLLLTIARATLDGDGGSIELQLDRRGARPDDPPPFVPSHEPERFDHRAFKRPVLRFDNEYGGFADNGDYVIVLEEGVTTPAPWINVMATPEFGCTVSEAGIGCTWAKNSHENRVTTWNNDPVSDGSGEAIYIRDEQSGEFWSPTPLPVRDREAYVVRHGKGHTTFEHASYGIEQHVEWFVPVDDPVRIVRLRLRNVSGRPRKLSVTQFVEWSLGSSRSMAQHLVVTWFDSEAHMLTAHNHFNMDFPGRAAFLACDRDLQSWTASRTEFVGRNRGPADPAAMHRTRLDGRSGRFHDNCGALMTHLEFAPGEEQTVTFLLGQAQTLEEARSIVDRYRESGAVTNALEDVKDFWNSILGSVQVKTPDPALDLMVNGNALYQALACRLWGRTATYQSSGAFGFRDQLQDVLCMMLSRPDAVRAQIVEASRHQFERGDVLHWWQPYSGRGVRTRITDDRHWMPLVVAEYVDALGDTGVLHERTPYLEGPDVEPDREDNYLQPSISEKTATVYEHCVAALESARATGPHGLPLMGGGDWNDGMNRVGVGGTGESVWLAWFLSVVLTRFAPICEIMDDHGRAEDYRQWAATLVATIEREAWDGAWYRRAYFDDGTPLGSHECGECRIDAIAQAWAVISGAGDTERALQALDSVEDQLVDREEGLIQLLAPPFDTMTHDPGYIKGYVPGVRENGGQYTHAAVWVALAHLLRGDGDEGHGLLRLINPINHGSSRELTDIYCVEPYVVVADVYAAEPHVGRGGWTWYTGSAGWFYRVCVQNALGLWMVTRDGDRYLSIDPCIPKSWRAYSMTYRHGDSVYDISVENPRGVNRGVARIELDGRVLDDPLIPLDPSGDSHNVKVTLLGG